MKRIPRFKKPMVIQMAIAAMCGLCPLFVYNSFLLWDATSTTSYLLVPGGGKTAPALTTTFTSTSRGTSAAFQLNELTNRAPPTSSSSSSSSLLNLEMIRSSLLAEAPWAESHGADHNVYLGGGMLYYSWAYAFQTRTIVVLGSGGGFVPRVLRQAQRDLEFALSSSAKAWGLARAGDISSKSSKTKLYLIDAHFPEAGWGSTFYANNPDSLMHREYSDIDYLFEKTDVAFEILKEKKVTIDYLHIDADHSYEQSWKDFTNYITLLSDHGVVSFHDTCFMHPTECHGTGVHRAITRLQEQADDYNLQVVDAHYLYNGIALAVRKNTPSSIMVSAYWEKQFCRNNALRLQMSGSSGFTFDRIGTSSTLGDFGNCSRFVDNRTATTTSSNDKKTTEKVEDGLCPFGKFRPHRKQSYCKFCIPGMVGRDCQTFKYSAIRAGRSLLPQHEQQQHPLAKQEQPHFYPNALSRLLVSFLSERRSRNILEWGLIPTTETQNQSQQPDRRVEQHSLLDYRGLSTFNPQLFVLVDPFVRDPVWWDNADKTQQVRLLPCKLQDIICDPNHKRKNAIIDKGVNSNDNHNEGYGNNTTNPVTDIRRVYESFLLLKQMDALVCMDCDQRLANGWAMQLLLDKVFHNVTSIVLEGAAARSSGGGMSRLDQLMKVLSTNEPLSLSSPNIGTAQTLTSSPSWHVETDVVLGEALSSSSLSSQPNVLRRIVLLYKQNNADGASA
ncbi:hypothetical protein ACA910_009127 [Epithemia clementina (nom. ined.)]